jgi:hypothetical protein
MNKIERVDAALKGAAVDRAPISFWGHSYLKEWSAEEQRGSYDWDYVNNPRL